MDAFKSIKVVQEVAEGKKQLKIYNPTSLPMIGIGAQGAVFRLSDKRCVKLYADPANAEWERKALAAAAVKVKFMPQLFEAGTNYVVMEFIHGPTLEVYLKERKQLEEWVAAQLLEIVRGMRRMKFNRIDTRLAHILVQTQGNGKRRLKVIDHIGAFRSRRRIPLMLFKSLHKAGLLMPFLRYVVKHDPKLYRKWLRKIAEGEAADMEDVPALPRLERLQ
ncbi:serine/threonine protein kinase [Paenibacillus koleovorans]|uniref:serine/threonine protein kinase n=1 Tax=Paenibacillus koleovorans TaxID=121608 RepID=UPI000FD9B50A|nr:serine/threonine protein kinase [Paenibacillus koleovorans]